MARSVRFRTKHGIIVALDAETVDDCKRTVEATTKVEGVVGYKLGMTTALRLGLAETVRQFRSHTDLPLLYDHQKAGPDVFDMAAKFAALCAEAKVDGLILFPLAGPRAVEGFVGESLKQGLLPLVGGDLPFPDFNVSGGGYVADDALERIIDKAVECGANHFVVPGNTTGKLRHHSERLKSKLRARPCSWSRASGRSAEKSASSWPRPTAAAFTASSAARCMARRIRPRPQKRWWTKRWRLPPDGGLRGTRRCI